MLVEKFINPLGTVMRDIDAYLVHHLNHQWVQAGRMRACTRNLEPVTR
jgi:hypothetical protein